MKWLFLSDIEEKLRDSDVYGKIGFPENFSQQLNFAYIFCNSDVSDNSHSSFICRMKRYYQ